MKRSIHLGTEEIVLDSNDLEFNEATIGDFQENLAVKYDYFGAKLAELEYIEDRLKSEMEEIYSRVYAEYKDEGCTDKLAESKAKADIAYQDKKKLVSEAKFHVKQMSQHLRSWDKAHDNATSRGHTLRKEMDKLHVDFATRVQQADDIGDKANNIVGGGR